MISARRLRATPRRRRRPLPPTRPRALAGRAVRDPRTSGALNTTIMAGRLVDLAVVGGMSVESPLSGVSLDDADVGLDDPFAAVYRCFATLHTVSVDTATFRTDPSLLISPKPKRKIRHSVKRIPGGMHSQAVPSAVVDTLGNFCLPDGAKVMPTAPPRSSNKCHSFVISESGYYGCCLTFYREVDARPFWLAYECVHPRNTNPDDKFEIQSPIGNVSDLNVSSSSSGSRGGSSPACPSPHTHIHTTTRCLTRAYAHTHTHARARAYARAHTQPPAPPPRRRRRRHCCAMRCASRAVAPWRWGRWAAGRRTEAARPVPCLAAHPRLVSEPDR